MKQGICGKTKAQRLKEKSSKTARCSAQQLVVKNAGTVSWVKQQFKPLPFVFPLLVQSARNNGMRSSIKDETKEKKKKKGSYVTYSQSKISCLALFSGLIQGIVFVWVAFPRYHNKSLTPI